MNSMANIKSIFIEVIEKEVLSSTRLSEKLVRGLFAGIYTRVGAYNTVENYIILFKEEKYSTHTKKVLDIFNLEHYNIVMIDIQSEDHTTYYNYRSDVASQRDAFGKASELLEYMQDNNRVQADRSLIDLGTYKDLDMNVATKSTHVDKKTYGAKNSNKGVYSTYRAPSKTVTKEETKPMVIKRKRATTKKQLQQMFETVQKIRNGTYKQPKLPEVTKECKKEATKSQDPYSNDWYM